MGIKTRRHHNNKGRKMIKAGHMVHQVKRMGKRLREVKREVKEV